MSYNPKTDWQLNEIVMPADMNRIEQGIADLDSHSINYLGEITEVTNILDNPSYGEYPYEGIISSEVATNIGLPAVEWNIKCFRASEGSGCQIAFPIYDYSGESPKYRLATKHHLNGSAYNISWGKWNNFSDGGNADTVNGKTVQLAFFRGISGLNKAGIEIASTDTADAIWKAIPNESVFATETQYLTDASWNFPAGTNQHSVLIMKLSNNRLLGMYLYPKSGGNVYFANVDANGAYAGNWRRLCDGGDAATANTAGTLATTASNICLRNLSSGTAVANTTNCPVGAWYGQYEEV